MPPTAARSSTPCSSTFGQGGIRKYCAAQCHEAVLVAVDRALAEFDRERDEPLPPRSGVLERERLCLLIDAWLAVEAQRGEAFRVVACEERHEVNIEGIKVALVVDRVDELADGRRVILDYKTGASVSQASWGEQRIAEPQLPIYAVLADNGSAAAPPLAAVALAKVRLGDSAFIGIAADAGLLPKVSGIGDKSARRLYPEMAHWDELLAHWDASLKSIAREIRAGYAAVSFEREQDLVYCGVLPLLRLAERQAQMEACSETTPGKHNDE
jgi:hypothetical protein